VNRFARLIYERRREEHIDERVLPDARPAAGLIADRFD